MTAINSKDLSQYTVSEYRTSWGRSLKDLLPNILATHTIFCHISGIESITIVIVPGSRKCEV